MVSLNDPERKTCPMRHNNGNCLPAGGFCTAVGTQICEALHNAYDCGKHSSFAEIATTLNWKCSKPNLDIIQDEKSPDTINRDKPVGLRRVEYPERRRMFFQEQFEAATQKLARAEKRGASYEELSDKGEIVSFYEWAVAMATIYE